MGDTRVQFGDDETGLALVLVTHDEPGHRESLVHDPLCVGLRSEKELSEVLVFVVILIALLSPHGDPFAVEDNDVEEGVEEEDGVRVHASNVQEGRLRWPIEGVGKERWLDHDQGVGRGLPHEHAAVVCCLVGGSVEKLEKLGSAQVEHELRVDRELGRQAERVRLVFPVVRELGAQADERAVHPSEDVCHFLGACAEDCNTGHEDCRGLLIKTAANRGRVGRVRVPSPAESRAPQPRLPIGVLVGGDELDEAPLVCRQRVLAAVRDLEVDCNRRGWIYTSHAPCRGAADTDLCFGDIRARLFQRRARPDRTGNLELPTGGHFKRGGKPHLKLATISWKFVGIPPKDPAEGFLEHGLTERVREDDEPSSALRADLHF
mmetsp:Transcript_16275/g.47754  ORF Transcript_16275/g.47754 Transcript_16275/m.47754 type:complete len:377 (-) Transcript_16275:1151-2281(-)